MVLGGSTTSWDLMGPYGTFWGHVGRARGRAGTDECAGVWAKPGARAGRRMGRMNYIMNIDVNAGLTAELNSGVNSEVNSG